MKILKKIFQTIFRTSVLSLLIASSPFENHTDKTVANMSSYCFKDDYAVVSPAKKEVKNKKREERAEKVEKIEKKEDKESSCAVYVTKTGKCFHKCNCACIKRSKIKIPLKEAISNRYRKCSKCFGKRNYSL